MSVGPPGYPTLVERAIRLIEARGGPVDAGELVAALFGSGAGPWTKLLGQIVRGDERLAALPDGRYALRSTSPPPVVACSSPTLCAGVVVFGAGSKPWRHPI